MRARTENGCNLRVYLKSEACPLFHAQDHISFHQIARLNTEVSPEKRGKGLHSAHDRNIVEPLRNVAPCTLRSLNEMVDMTPSDEAAYEKRTMEQESQDTRKKTTGAA